MPHIWDSTLLRAQAKQQEQQSLYNNYNNNNKNKPILELVERTTLQLDYEKTSHKNTISVGLHNDNATSAGLRV